ncbi:hypothetical protein O181_014296 [Austropuccinia psidii MF-1]|uniref:Uncharacterized protein n=1 Tax=Austropuccinia psidii MF-1 TaxID=1389203 RepID=A0A9Q3GP10_9BASI|nr:hypothetical protein [Austropuccinia psidii MF-1]
MHPSTGDKQKEQPSSGFLILLALPLHTTTPAETLEDSSYVWELREEIWTEDGNDDLLESPTTAAHDFVEDKSLLKESEG